MPAEAFLMIKTNYDPNVKLSFLKNEKNYIVFDRCFVWVRFNYDNFFIRDSIVEEYPLKFPVTLYETDHKVWLFVDPFQNIEKNVMSIR